MADRTPRKGQGVFHQAHWKTTPDITEDILQSQRQITGSTQESFRHAPLLEMDDVDWTFQEEKRDQWYGKMEFLLTCLGYSGGLTNVWRYPSRLYHHGGGAFFVPYCGVMLLCVLPIIYLELIMGQFCALGPIEIWKLIPLFRGIGYSMLILGAVVFIYNSLQLPLSLYYFISSARSFIEYNRCNNSWNSPNCLEADDFGKYCHYNTSTEITRNCSNATLPSKEFFENHVLKISSRITEFGWPSWEMTLLLLATYLFLFFGIVKGIQNRVKIMYVTVVLPWILLLMILIQNLFNEGSANGVKYFMQTNWSSLQNVDTWVDGACHAFFSMGPCLGVYTTLASYNNFHYNIKKDALLLIVFNILVSFFTGFLAFGIIGTMASRMNVEIEDSFHPGLSLLYVTFAEGLSNLNMGALWACFMFISVYFLTYNSQLCLIYSVYSAINDYIPIAYRSPMLKRLVAVALCISFFILSLFMLLTSGVYWFHLFDYFVTRHATVLIGGLMCLTLSWLYGWANIASHVYTMFGDEPPSFMLRIFWQVVSPSLLMIIFVCDWITPWITNLPIYDFPAWSITLVVVASYFLFVPIPLFVLLDIWKARCKMRKIKERIQPVEIWSSDMDEERNAWLQRTTPDYINYAFLNDNKSTNETEINPYEAIPDDLDDSDMEPWTGEWRFFLSCISYTIGLNNFWRFPFLCYQHGGGTFFIPYILALLFLGIPLYFLELSLGQYSGLGPLAVWEMVPLLRGIGFGMLILLFYLIIYHNVILSWIVYYIFGCLDASEPWTSCRNVWNTANCSILLPPRVNGSTFVNRTAASEEYFANRMLGLLSDRKENDGLQWNLVLCGLLVWLILTIAVIRGFRSSGRGILVTASVSIALMLILLIWSVTLEGSAEGVGRYFNIQWKNLANVRIWSDASYHVILSLGLGYGTVILLANHNRFYVRCKRIAFCVCLVDFLFNLLSGFLMFAILGILANTMQISFDEVISRSRSVLFVAISSTSDLLPFPHLLISLFFLSIVCLGLDTAMLLIYTITQSLRDWMWLFNRIDKLYVTLFVQAILLLSSFIILSNGAFHLVVLFDLYAMSWPTMLICLLELTGIAYVFGFEEYNNRISWMFGHFLSNYWKIMWRFISPIYLLVNLIFHWFWFDRGSEVISFPWWIHLIGALMLISPILAVLLVPTGYFISSSGTLREKYLSLFEINPDWEPNGNPEDALDDAMNGRRSRRNSIFYDRRGSRLADLSTGYQ